MTVVVCEDHGTPLPDLDRVTTELTALAGLCKDPSVLSDAGIADLEKLTRHHVRIHRREVNMRTVWQPIAPSAMLDRIHSMLGPEHAGILDLISRRCPNCR